MGTVKAGKTKIWPTFPPMISMDFMVRTLSYFFTERASFLSNKLLENALLPKISKQKSLKHLQIPEIKISNSEFLIAFSVYASFTIYCKPIIILNKSILKILFTYNTLIKVKPEQALGLAVKTAVETYLYHNACVWNPALVPDSTFLVMETLEGGGGGDGSSTWVLATYVGDLNWVYCSQLQLCPSSGHCMHFESEPADGSSMSLPL